MSLMQWRDLEHYNMYVHILQAEAAVPYTIAKIYFTLVVNMTNHRATEPSAM